jgi:protein-L-isoaspartate(D-aspartate) O-methyltransferase
MTRAASVTGSSQADELRQKMTDVLVEKGWVTSPEVEAAFRSVPRHLFTPDGTTLDQAYDPDQSVITKSDADGVHLSSVSAPFVQAAMIGQAGVRPGMRVLEVGSGGYQAALLAEVTGPGGHVVTMDIDPEVTSRTRELLEQTGHASGVTVVTGDAGGGAPGHGEFDAIIVTCGAWDIPPAWTGQLVPGQVLKKPPALCDMREKIIETGRVLFQRTRRKRARYRLGHHPSPASEHAEEPRLQTTRINLDPTDYRYSG